MSIASQKPQPHWDAELYKNNSMKLQYSTAMELLDKEDFTQKSLMVLDIGCGDGKITKEIADRVAGNQGYVLGIDLSENMIAFAKREYRDVPNLSFDVMDAEDIKLDRPFDRIYSFFCWQWLPNKQKAFNEVARLLKKGGLGAFVMTRRNQAFLAARRDLISREEWKSYFVGYADPTKASNDPHYLDYIQNAGLSLLHYNEFQKRVLFDDFEELKNFIITVTPETARIPGSLKNKFLDELVDDFYKRIEALDGNKNYFQCDVMIAHTQK